MPYKDPEQRKENHRQHRDERNAKKRAHHHENRVDINKKKAENYKKNQENRQEYARTRYSDIITCAISMIVSKIIDEKKWHSFCQFKRHSGNNARKYPYSCDFTDDIIFDKMTKGCFYCGNLATTIDRLDSNLGHTPDNCVGCCRPCNISKGNSDPDTFIRKAYYRIRNKYFDDVEDIWSDNVKKPNWYSAKKKSQEQKREFSLTKEEWELLGTRDCSYCGRIRPEGKWNGVDRIVPDAGYIPKNTVSSCNDCNNDKGTCSVYDAKNRNEKIANRMDTGDILISGWEKKLRTR
jgi:hypothetical protein